MQSENYEDIIERSTRLRALEEATNEELLGELQARGVLLLNGPEILDIDFRLCDEVRLYAWEEGVAGWSE